MEFLTVAGATALVLLTCSCANSSENKKQLNKYPSPKALVVQKPPSSFADTVVVDRESAVFYNPDSAQLVKIKLANEKRVYETLTHDCYYMMKNAREVIKRHWSRIQIIEVIKARYILFVKKDRSRICIDLNTRKDMCGMYIFDLKKDPEPVDMPNVDTFLGFYFGLSPGK